MFHVGIVLAREYVYLGMVRSDVAYTALEVTWWIRWEPREKLMSFSPPDMSSCAVRNSLKLPYVNKQNSVQYYNQIISVTAYPSSTDLLFFRSIMSSCISWLYKLLPPWKACTLMLRKGSHSTVIARLLHFIIIHNNPAQTQFNLEINAYVSVENRVLYNPSLFVATSTVTGQ